VARRPSTVEVDVATPRTVRIPRSTAPARPGPAAPSAAPASELTVEHPVDHRANLAGRQRASRLAMIYLLALIVMYLGFVALDRASAGGSSPAVTTGLLAFTVVAVALAVGGTFVTLSPAPQAVEVAPAAVVVVEWTGRRRRFPPLEDLRVEVVRRYPAGFLSRSPVETVELAGGGRRRTYQLTEGLLPERRPTRPAS
jgi:hypothetical protein